MRIKTTLPPCRGQLFGRDETMLNVLSLFSGIGAFEKALDNEGIKYNLVNYCEIDKYASRSYAAIHNVSEELNLIDVTKIDTSSLSDIDLITYGFPCQDISQAGNQKGFTDKNGERTRSGLFFEALRIIKDLQPKYAIAENVKALTSKKFTAEFATVLDSLEQAGYHNYYKVLNAKDFGIPQNRERVFIVSIRKDVDFKFTFPVGEPLKLRLADLLENEVDTKFYLSDEQIKRIKTSSYCTDQRRIQSKERCDTLHARDWKDPKCVKVMQVGNLINDDERNFKNPQCGRVYDSVGLSPTLSTMQGGNREPKIIDPTVCEERKDEGLSFFKDNVCGALRTKDSCGDKRVLVPTAAAMRGRQNGQQLEISDREYSNALTTVQKDSLVKCDFRVRKLTPKECWRLMGFDDEDFHKARNAGISNSQLYKQAGNSIVVNVLQAIFRQFNFEKVSAVDCKYENEKANR